MKALLDKIIYFVITIFIFLVLWKVVGEIWEAFVPLNYKTNLLGIIIIMPITIAISFIFSTLLFSYIKNSN